LQTVDAAIFTAVNATINTPNPKSICATIKRPNESAVLFSNVSSNIVTNRSTIRSAFCSPLTTAVFGSVRSTNITADHATISATFQCAYWPTILSAQFPTFFATDDFTIDQIE
jgi:hypothetical protein